jgi:hypothetical protein
MNSEMVSSPWSCTYCADNATNGDESFNGVGKFKAHQSVQKQLTVI